MRVVHHPLFHYDMADHSQKAKFASVSSDFIAAMMFTAVEGQFGGVGWFTAIPEAKTRR